MVVGTGWAAAGRRAVGDVPAPVLTLPGNDVLVPGPLVSSCTCRVPAACFAGVTCIAGVRGGGDGYVGYLACMLGGPGLCCF